MATAILTSYIVGGDWIAVAFNSKVGGDFVNLAMNLGSIEGDMGGG